MTYTFYFEYYHGHNTGNFHLDKWTEHISNSLGKGPINLETLNVGNKRISNLQFVALDTGLSCSNNQGCGGCSVCTAGKNYCGRTWGYTNSVKCLTTGPGDGPGPKCTNCFGHHNQASASYKFNVMTPKEFTSKTPLGHAPPKSGYAFYAYKPLINKYSLRLLSTPYKPNHNFHLDSNISALYSVTYDFDLKTKYTSPLEAKNPIFSQINTLLSIVSFNALKTSKTKIHSKTIYQANQETAKQLLDDLYIVAGRNMNNSNISQYFINQLTFAINVSATNYQITNVVGNNQKMTSGTSVNNGVVSLSMQTDGNLVLYNYLTSKPIFATNTQYKKLGVAQNTMDKAYMILESNGNLVVKNNSNTMVWSSGIQSGSSGGSIGLMNNFIVRYNPSTMQIYWMINPAFWSGCSNTNLQSTCHNKGILHWIDTSAQCNTLSTGLGTNICSNTTSLSSYAGYFIGESLKNWGINNYYNVKSSTYNALNFKSTVSFNSNLSLPRASDSYGAKSGGIYFVEPVHPVVFFTQKFILPPSVIGNYTIYKNTTCSNSNNTLFSIETTSTNGSTPCKTLCTNNKNCVGFTFDNNKCVLHSSCSTSTTSNSSSTFYKKSSNIEYTYTFYLDFSSSWYSSNKSRLFGSATGSLSSPTFSLNTYTGKTFTPNVSTETYLSNQLNETALAYLVYKSSTSTNTIRSSVTYFPNNQGVEFSSGLGPFSDYTYSISYKVNMTSVNWVDLWGILQCCSNFPNPPSSARLNSNGLTVSIANYNTAYQMMYDYCLQRKTECVSGTPNICCSNFPTSSLPSILSDGATAALTNKNSLYAWYNNYQLASSTYTGVTKGGAAAKKIGIPVPSYSQGRLIYLNFCSNNSNWLSQDCKNFYQNIYTSTNIDASVENYLTQKCATQKVGDSTTSDVCGCYYPSSVYSQFKEKNQLTNVFQDTTPTQCYYPYCFNSSNPSLLKPDCPSITACISNVTNIEQAGGNIDNNKTYINVVQNCQNTTKNETTGKKSSTGSSYESSSDKSTSTSKKGSKYTKGSPTSDDKDDTSKTTKDDTKTKNKESNTTSNKKRIAIIFILVVLGILLLLLGIQYFRSRSSSYKTTSSSNTQSVSQQTHGKQNQSSSVGGSKQGGKQLPSVGGKQGPQISSVGGKQGPQISSVGGKQGPQISSVGGKQGAKLPPVGGKQGPQILSAGGKQGAKLLPLGGSKQGPQGSKLLPLGGSKQGGKQLPSVGGKQGPQISSVGGKQGPQISSVGGKQGPQISSAGGKQGAKLPPVGGKQGPQILSAGGKQGAKLLPLGGSKQGPQGSKLLPLGGSKQGPQGSKLLPLGGSKQGPQGSKLPPLGGSKQGPQGSKLLPLGGSKQGPQGSKLLPLGGSKQGPQGSKLPPLGGSKQGPQGSSIILSSSTI
jgi:hypothetical protein